MGLGLGGRARVGVVRVRPRAFLPPPPPHCRTRTFRERSQALFKECDADDDGNLSRRAPRSRPERSELYTTPRAARLGTPSPRRIPTPPHHPACRISGELMVLLQRLEVASLF